jgi:hypothetical protein
MGHAAFRIEVTHGHLDFTSQASTQRPKHRLSSFRATNEARAETLRTASANCGADLLTRLETCRDCEAKTHGRFDRSGR